MALPAETERRKLPTGAQYGAGLVSAPNAEGLHNILVSRPGSGAAGWEYRTAFASGTEIARGLRATVVLRLFWRSR